MYKRKTLENQFINFPSRALFLFESGLESGTLCSIRTAAVASSVNTDNFERIPASEWLIGGFLIEVVTAAMRRAGVFPFG